jgi:ribosomal protein L3
MIKLKTPYTHIDRAVPITGTLQIEIASWQTMKDATIYQIEDFIVDENQAKRLINSRQKRVENAEVNQLAELVEIDNEFTGMTKTETEWAKAKIGLLLFVQNDLVDSVSTIYGRLPNDWEFSE